MKAGREGREMLKTRKSKPFDQFHRLLNQFVGGAWERNEIIIITSDSDKYGTTNQRFDQQQENTLSFRLLFQLLKASSIRSVK